MIEPRLGVDRLVATEFTAVLERESPIRLTLVPAIEPPQSDIEALLANRADIALVSNNEAYTAGIATVMPMYANVLHVLLVDPLSVASEEELLHAGRVYAGPPDSSTRLMLQRFAAHHKIDTATIDFVDSVQGECPEVIVVFAPILRDIETRFEQCSNDVSYRLWQGLNDSMSIDATTLLVPSMHRFRIPAGTYGPDLSPGDVTTLAVDMMLVARRDVPAAVVYDLISEIIRLRPALTAVEPTLFHGLSDSFDSSASTFILHPGAQDYVERDEPTAYERYSGVAEVAVTVFLALLSATVGGFRIYNMRRKNRIDRFYSEALELRQSLTPESTESERRRVISELRALQATAFDLLVDEKLAADESFRIFITLSNDIIGELQAPILPDKTASAGSA